MFAAGLFFFYDVIIHQAKYDKYGTRYLVFIVSLLCAFLGVRGLYLIPNRYKVLSVSSSLSIDSKKERVVELIKIFGDPYYENSDTFYSFKYKKNWWGSDYQVFISFDIEAFYVSVQSIIGGYYREGMIDFGGTEKVRQRMITTLTELVNPNEPLLTKVLSNIGV